MTKSHPESNPRRRGGGPRNPPDRPFAEAAGRAADAVVALFGSQTELARTCGVGPSAVSKAVNGRKPPHGWLLLELAERGADVSKILTGAGAAPALVPLYDRLLPTPPGGGATRRYGSVPATAGRYLGVVAVPEVLSDAEAYAVTLTREDVAGFLGGAAPTRPRAGDTLFVAAAVDAARGLVPDPPGPRSPAALPPPVVLLRGRPRLSFVHEVRLHGDVAAAGLVRLPLEAAYRGGASNLPDGAGATLTAVGFAVWRAGPVSA